MARPRKHDGRLFRKEESKFWWMDYRDRAGRRLRESTNTEDWDEAQKRLRERLEARDGNTLPLLRKGEAHIRTMVGALPRSLLQTTHSGTEDAPCPIPAWQSTLMLGSGRFFWSI